MKTDIKSNINKNTDTHTNTHTNTHARTHARTHPHTNAQTNPVLHSPHLPLLTYSSDCGCNGHASLCHYDVDKGYGICDDCSQNTAGDKCDQCIQFYYVNPDKDKYNETNPAPDNCSG